jgi:hypothetical protein
MKYTKKKCMLGKMKGSVLNSEAKRADMTIGRAIMWKKKKRY